MKFLLLSDLHFTSDNIESRVDNVFSTCINKFTYILEYASINRLPIIQAGDFFDRPRSWKALSSIIDILIKYKIKIYSVFGQHDLFLYSKSISETSLGVLVNTGLINQLNENISDIPVIGYSWGNPIKDIDNSAKVLVVHREIGLGGKGDVIHPLKFLRDYPMYDLILCADQHEKFIFKEGGRIICNTGPILRRSIDLTSHEPCFFVYDIEIKEIEEVKIPYEKDVFSSEYIKTKNRKKEIDFELNKFIKSTKEISNLNYSMDIKRNILNFVKENDVEDDVIEVIEGYMKGEILAR